MFYCIFYLFYYLVTYFSDWFLIGGVHFLNSQKTEFMQMHMPRFQRLALCMPSVSSLFLGLGTGQDMLVCIP